MRILCSICTEVFDGISDVSVVPCGHMFHSSCLGQWIAQSLTCPQCRSRITLKSTIHKLFFNQSDTQSEYNLSNLSRLENELEGAKLALREKKHEKNNFITEKVAMKVKIEQLKESCR